jgi:hypothetical protein
MTMKIADPENEGQEIEVYTVEEMNAQKAEVDAAKAEADRLQRVSAEKTDNFKKLNDMTEQERAAMSAEKIEILKRTEAAEAKAQGLEDKYNSDTQARIKNDTEAALAKYHGGNAELKKLLEDNFALINIPETDTASIQKRAAFAANMIAGASGGVNPLMQHAGGSAPVSVDQTRTQEFLGSDRGKAALSKMGIKEEPKK